MTSSPSRDSVQELRFHRDMLATRFPDEVERVIAPLRSLDEHQRVAASPWRRPRSS